MGGTPSHPNVDLKLARELADEPAVDPYLVPKGRRSRSYGLRIAIIASSAGSPNPDPEKSRDFRGRLRSRCRIWLH